MRTDDAPRRAGSRGASPGQLLIIGVDAGSPALFRQWSAAGDLPNLSRLMRSGRVCGVENPYGLEAGTVWPVFHSGLMPGRQPLYDGRRVFVPEDYSVRWCGPEETPPTVWRRLSDQGVRCLLIDPPSTHVDPRINGTMIVDWGGHVPADGQHFALKTQPPEVADEVLELVGADPAGHVICDRMEPVSVDDHRRFRDIYLERIAAKGKLGAHMLRHKSWDLALVVSSDLHCTGHHLWHVNDPGHPRHSAKLESALGEPLRDCYRAFDKALGEMLGAVGAETTVMVFGSHGMGPSYSGTGLLDRILLQLDRHGTSDAVEDAARQTGRPAPRLDPLRRQAQAAWKSLPAELHGHIETLRRHVGGLLGLPPRMGSSEHRRFFEVYANDAAGGVRLNLKGREGRGIVEPDEAQKLVDYLIRELRAVKNTETGQPLVEDVIATSELYGGPHAGRMPDLLVRWNRSAPIRSVHSPAIGGLSHEYPNNRTGDHTPEGFCVIAGPGVEAGLEGETVRTADFASSIAAFYGLEIGAHDGRPFSLTGVEQAA